MPKKINKGQIYSEPLYFSEDEYAAQKVIPIDLFNPVTSMASWTKRQGEVTSHSRSYGEELQRRIIVQLASAIGDLESVIGIRFYVGTFDL